MSPMPSGIGPVIALLEISLQRVVASRCITDKNHDVSNLTSIPRYQVDALHPLNDCSVVHSFVQQSPSQKGKQDCQMDLQGD